MSLSTFPSGIAWSYQITTHLTLSPVQLFKSIHNNQTRPKKIRDFRIFSSYCKPVLCIYSMAGGQGWVNIDQPPSPSPPSPTPTSPTPLSLTPLAPRGPPALKGAAEGLIKRVTTTSHGISVWENQLLGFMIR